MTTSNAPEAAAGGACTFRVRSATSNDIEAITQIERLAFTDPWSRASFESLLGFAHVRFCVAERCDAPGVVRDDVRPRAEVAGYAVAWIAADEAELANVAVAPSLRGRGVGALLLDAVIDDVTRRGAVSIFLEVRESNAAARRLYAARRFVEVGRRRGYYRRPQEDALVLVRSR